MLGVYYKPEIELLRGKPLHFEMVIESANSDTVAYGDEKMDTEKKLEKYTATCREYPEFVYDRSFGLNDAYYALCEWLKHSSTAMS